MGKMAYILAEMSASHRQAVIDIFNYFVTESHAAFLSEVVDYSFFDHFLKIAHGYPARVVQAGPGQVVGFGFMRPHYLADSSKRIAQVTYFILPEYTRQGLGAALLAFFIGEARKMGIVSLLASISSRNQQSLRFHQKNGFRECGRSLNVGCKFGEDFDAVWMLKQLE